MLMIVKPNAKKALQLLCLSFFFLPTLRFRTDRSIAGTGFTAVVSFPYGPQQGCGGRTYLSGAGDTKEISSLDTDRNNRYENNLDCQWVVVGSEGLVMSLSFTR